MLFEQDVNPPEAQREIRVEISKDADFLRPDTATVNVTVAVQDGSIWSNEGRANFDLPVDIVPPRLELLTTQHNVAQGGLGLAFYRLSEDPQSLEVHGVQVGKRFFKGSPGEAWDPALKGQAGVFGTLFRLPFPEEDETVTPKAVARDSAGNVTEVSLPIYVIGKRQPAEALKLTRPFMENKIPELAREFHDETGAAIPEDADPTQSLLKQFLFVNQQYRSQLGKRIVEMVGNPTPEKLWDGLFIRPMAAKPTARFFEKRSYDFEGHDLSTAIHEGVDLADVKNAEVFAANRGRVVFSDRFGIYGNAVIIDHGLGLSTLYGHLASSSVSPGTIVEKGQLIGRSGETGLAGGDHLHYEIRLQGVATSPFEWWDDKWIKDRVTTNIEAVKSYLGVGAPPKTEEAPTEEAKPAAASPKGGKKGARKGR